MGQSFEVEDFTARSERDLVASFSRGAPDPNPKPSLALPVGGSPQAQTRAATSYKNGYGSRGEDIGDFSIGRRARGQR